MQKQGPLAVLLPLFAVSLFHLSASLEIMSLPLVGSSEEKSQWLASKLSIRMWVEVCLGGWGRVVESAHH